MHHHDSEPCWSPHCAPHQTHPDASVRELIAEAEARGAERVERWAKRGAERLERVERWARSHPPTHDVRHTEGYWRAQADLQALLAEDPDGRPDLECHADSLMCQAETRDECDNPQHWTSEPPSDGRGLHDKYRVERLNDPEDKHTDCRYFVLDPQHDEAARSAIFHYAESTSDDALAADLLRWLDDLDRDEATR